MRSSDYKAWRTVLHGAEVKIMLLNDAPLVPLTLTTPEACVAYLTAQLPDSIRYSSESETMVAVYLTARHTPISWQVISNGTLDTLLVHPREVYRGAIVLNAGALIIAHNHPSGDPTPSESDIKVTRDMIRAGQLLRIDLVDSLVLGRATPERPKAWASLRELGYFYGGGTP